MLLSLILEMLTRMLVKTYASMTAYAHTSCVNIKKNI